MFGRWQQGLADVGWNTLYWDNHDQPRVVSRFGDDGEYWYESATLLATVLHLHRGTPFIFQGEEIGMTNFPFTSIDQFHDVESLNYYTQSVEIRGRDPQVALSMITPMSRDNARTPMQWDDGPNAGFTKGTPWLAVNPNADRINAAAQVDDPRSVLAHYKRLIALRHEDPVVQLGRFDLLLPDHQRLWAFTRSGEHSRLLVVANVGGEAIDCDVDMTGELVLTNYPDQAAQLRAWEVRVYRQELP
ncbi:MAG: alpha-amylase family glycosyl hydrolase [Candidatus Nanopelagicales bacterium]